MLLCNFFFLDQCIDPLFQVRNFGLAFDQCVLCTFQILDDLLSFRVWFIVGGSGVGGVGGLGWLVVASCGGGQGGDGDGDVLCLVWRREMFLLFRPVGAEECRY